MRGLVFVVVMTVLLGASNIVLAKCPGNVLNGDHKPEGTADKWIWTIEKSAAKSEKGAAKSEKGTVKIEKGNTVVTGNVTMLCSKDTWFVYLFGMQNKVKYICTADIVGNSIQNGLCTASVLPVIEVTGIFSTR